MGHMPRKRQGLPDRWSRMAVDIQIYLTANEMITYGTRNHRLVYNVTVPRRRSIVRDLYYVCIDRPWVIQD